MVVSVSSVETVSRIGRSGAMPDACYGKQNLIFAEKGSLRIAMEGAACLIHGGEAMLISPDQHCSIQLQDGSGAIWAAFFCSSPAIAPLERRIFPVLPFYLSALEQEASSSQLGREQMLRSILEQILILGLRHGGLEWQERTVSPTSTQQHAWMVHQIRDYLHTNYAQRITLELLAVQFDISITQLKRIFREQTGTTIISYLTNLRIQRAKELIRQGSMNFTQIAEAVGYENIYYFSTQFKKQTGLTPTEFSRTQDSH